MVLKAHGIVLAHGIEKGARGIEGSWYCLAHGIEKGPVVLKKDKPI